MTGCERISEPDKKSLYESFYEQVRERMLRYAVTDTQSQRNSTAVPTTKKQFDLAFMLRDELADIGVSEVFLDEEHCIVYGKIPSFPAEGCSQPFGLIAHMDTSPDAESAGIKPWVLENYRGGDIVLNEEKGIVMRISDFPNLGNYIGQDLILTDGTTLLGGDDKAAIASIMTFAQYLCENPEIPHPMIALAFTPDEEVGGLAKDLDLKRFEAPVAYTLDGDHLGYYQDETFNASSASVTIAGRSVHTGTAKGIMINAADIAAEFMEMIPKEERPQTTEGREGFYHVTACNASCEKAVIQLIIRDHDSAVFERRCRFLEECCASLGEKYGRERIKLEIVPTYRNMKEVIDTVPYLIENLKNAIAACGLVPVCEPFRGGTDGAALSHRGLPCPNLSAGYENAHGRFEYVPIRSMAENVKILLALAEQFCNGWNISG